MGWGNKNEMMGSREPWDDADLVSCSTTVHEGEVVSGHDND